MQTKKRHSLPRKSLDSFMWVTMFTSQAVLPITIKGIGSHLKTFPFELLSAVLVPLRICSVQQYEEETRLY